MAKMTTFVLVHGAWHGGWCYKRVARGGLRRVGVFVMSKSVQTKAMECKFFNKKETSVRRL
jgi:hypothetical protein